MELIVTNVSVVTWCLGDHVRDRMLERVMAITRSHVRLITTSEN